MPTDIFFAEILLPHKSDQLTLFRYSHPLFLAFYTFRIYDKNRIIYLEGSHHETYGTARWRYTSSL